MWSGAWLYFLSHILVFTLWICGQNNPTEGVKINNSYMDTYQLNGDESRQSLMWCKCFSERYSASLTTICDGLLRYQVILFDVWPATSKDASSLMTDSYLAFVMSRIICSGLSGSPSSSLLLLWICFVPFLVFIIKTINRHCSYNPLLASDSG